MGLAPPPVDGPPTAGRPAAGRVLLLTLGMALAALVGNVLHLPLLFGVDILFGSVAALLALVWLGTWPGIAVALAGSLYTWVLWGHGCAVLILTAEVAAVAWLRARALGRGPGPPPLAVAVALYWFLLGIPAVLVCYRFGLGIGWTATLLIAAKQALNGILNAGLAELVLLAAAALRRRPGALPLARVLFSALLTALLMPAMLTVAWEGWDLRDRMERDQAERLAMLTRLAVADAGRSGHGVAAEGAADPSATARAIERLLADYLPPGSDPRVRLLPASGAPEPAPAPTPTAVLRTAAPGVDLVLRGGRITPRVTRWREARYRLAVPAPRIAPGQVLEMEISAAPLIDRFQGQLTRLLLILLGVAGLGVLLAQFLSRHLVGPLRALVEAIEALPAAIREDRPWSAPPPGLIQEPARLAEAAGLMASSLAEGFHALRADQEAQARRRALADLQAQALGWLVTEPLDETAFAARLCRHLEAMLPGRRFALTHPAPGGAPEVRTLGPPEATPTAATREILDTAGTLAALALDSIRLRQRHEVLLEALSQAGTGIVMVRPDGGDWLVSYVNRGFELLTGYGAAETLDRPCRFLAGANPDQPGAATVRAALADGRPCQTVLGGCRRDGSPFWYSLNLSPMRITQGRNAQGRNTQGEVAHYFGVLQDVSESVATLERLRRSEARLAESQHLADMGSWYMDLRTGEVAWSDQGYRLLGYAPGTIAPTLANFMRRIHPADRALVTGQLRAVRAGAALPEERDLRICRPDGEERVVHYRARAHLGPDGRVELVEGVSIDITERKRTEDALRAQQEQLRLVLANLEAERARLANVIGATRVGTWEWEVQTGATVFNDRWAEIIGYRLDELAPVGIHTWTEHTHPEDLAISRARLQAHFSGERESYESEARMRHRDGRWVWVLDQGRVMQRDAAGRPLLMSGIHQDITARKEAELALAEREAMLAELLTLAAQFVGVPDQGLPALTEWALERIGRFARADRSYLFRLDQAAGTLNNTLEWVTEGVSPAIELNLAIPLADLPELTLRLRLGEPVVVPRVADLPADWSGERAVFESQDIRSLMVAPLVVGEELLGCVGFDAVGEPRDWSAVEVRFLQVFANILAGTMDRARATADLRAGNTRYEELARQSRSMSWEIDPGGRYTYVSPACEQVLGYRAQELAGRHLWDLAPAPDQDAVRARLQALMEGREPLRDFDRPCEGVDGWGLWLTTNGAPFYAADGTYLGYRGIDTDITDRHIALDLIRESEARLRAVFENAPIGMALVGADQRLTLINRALAAFLGQAPEELVGLPFAAMGRANDGDRSPDSLADLRLGRPDAFRVTRHFRRPDGGVVWGDLRVSLLPTRPGAVPLPLVMVEDVTELHAATERQRALEGAMKRYSALLEDLVDLINRPLPPAEKDRALLDLGCRTLGIEAAVLGLVQEGGGQRVLVAVPEDWTTAADALSVVQAEALAHRGSPCVVGTERLPGAGFAGLSCACVGLAFDAPRPDGQADTLCLSLWGADPGQELGDPERQMIRLIAQRIAAVRYQEQIHRDLVEARERETIGHLASGVAHDFNNLLGVIDANIYFLGLGLPGAATDPELRQVLDETQSALGQAKVITSGMLSLSRAGGLPLESVDLNEAVAELECILRQVLPASIALGVEIPTGLKARTNAGFLQAALLNLALNARDAMPRGGRLTIAAGPGAWAGTPPLAVGDLTPGDRVELRVSDTGSGIDPGVIGHIFDPLFSTKAKQRGHGLGLFMVQEFVTRSGAGLAVESHPGRGTCFRLLLPPVAAGTPRLASPAAPVPAGLPPGLRVLMVEDDPRVREAVTRLLTLDGAQVVQAEHGRAALAALDREPGIDLVLSDVAMPELDGLGLYRRLLRDRPDLPVILMTGQHDAPTGVADLPERPLVLRKPLDPQVLRAAIAARVVPR